jgi:hypothetical protein
MSFTDKHHRIPQSKGGSNESWNISYVDRKMHQAYHTLFGNKDPEEVARLLNRFWIDPRVEFLVVKKCAKDVSNHGRDCDGCECTERQSSE